MSSDNRESQYGSLNAKTNHPAEVLHSAAGEPFWSPWIKELKRPNVSERAVAFIVATLGVFVPLFEAIWAHKSEDEFQKILVATLAGLSFWSVLGMFALAKETATSKKRLHLVIMQAEKLGSALSLERRELEQLRDDHSRLVTLNKDVIAPSFQTLSVLVTGFQNRLQLYSNRLSEGIVRSVNDGTKYSFPFDEEKGWRSELDGVYKDLLSYLCDLAVRITLLKKNGEKIHTKSANIKIITPQTHAYRVLHRSSNTHIDRLTSDQKRERNPIPMFKNKMYANITSDQPWCKVDDINAYLAEMAKDKESFERGNVDYPFVEPSPDAAKHYTSCLVVPIFARSLARQDASARTLSDEIFGFFCVDCKEKAFFDLEYDRLTMQELANYAGAAIVGLLAAEQLRTAALNAANVTDDGKRS